VSGAGDSHPADAADRASGRLRAGTVGRAHGLDGSFHVGAVAASVFALVALGSEIEVAGRMRRVVRLAGHAGRPIVRLEGSERREDAEALRGQAIYVSREAAPALQEDEWWAEDLEGCAVRDGERAVGTVTALLGLPSCEVLEVRREGAPEAPALLVPLIRDAVREVDLAAGVIDVDLTFLGEA
jgi:16S rRNA processing protein RimM